MGSETQKALTHTTIPVLVYPLTALTGSPLPSPMYRITWSIAPPMRAPYTFVALLVALGALSVSAADRKDMVGKWRWQKFTIEVRECKGDSLCATIVEGPKNVGMDMFASQLVAKDGEWFGQIAHPETKEIYNTRFQQKSKDRWRLDGCSPASVCLTGELVRTE